MTKPNVFTVIIDPSDTGSMFGLKCWILMILAKKKTNMFLLKQESKDFTTYIKAAEHQPMTYCVLVGKTELHFT